MTIRPATHDDVAAIRRLMLVCDLAETVPHETFTHPCLVAERDGDVIGIVQGVLAQPYAVVTMIAVHPAEQHHGVGRALLGALEDTMRACGMQAWVACTSREHVLFALEAWGAKNTGIGYGFVRVL